MAPILRPTDRRADKTTGALSLTVTTQDSAETGIGFDDMLFCVGAPVPTLPSSAWLGVLILILLAGTGFYIQRIRQT